MRVRNGLKASERHPPGHSFCVENAHLGSPGHVILMHFVRLSVEGEALGLRIHILAVALVCLVGRYAATVL